MTRARPYSVLDVVTHSRWFGNNRARRLIFSILLILLAILSVFPRIYAANVKLAPQESNTAGLSAILSQLGGGSYAALLGRAQPIEVDLAIARSYEVRRDVLHRLGVKDAEGSAELRRQVLRLEDDIDMQALRGNLIQIVVHDRNADRALFIARAYAAAMQERLTELSRQSTANKRKILNERFVEARDRLARAQADVNQFQRANQLVMPETQLTVALEQSAALQGRLKAKQVELQTVLQFNTPESFAAQRVRAELAALQQQVRAAEQNARVSSGLTATGIAPIALQFENLTRELKFAQGLYDSYTRYLEGAAIEDLTAQYNLQQIEPPYIEPNLQFNIIPLMLLAGVFLLALASEFIVMRPAPGTFADKAIA
ncbi:MAG: hypothetical protein ABR588_12105 [Sphingomicrobium sp.]|nr:hypothetical protein [Sphingomonadales bacterium]